MWTIVKKYVCVDDLPSACIYIVFAVKYALKETSKMTIFPLKIAQLKWFLAYTKLHQVSAHVWFNNAHTPYFNVWVYNVHPLLWNMCLKVVYRSVQWLTKQNMVDLLEIVQMI